MRSCRKLGIPSLNITAGKHILSCFLTVLAVFFFGMASSQPYKVVKISLAEGLSQSMVQSLSQDPQGFIWAGTQDGLNRYDGLGFQTYYHKPFDTTSLSSGNVRSTLHDSKGRFWIGTDNYGLNLYRPDHDNFRTFKHNPDDKTSILNNTINVIYEGPGGTIWLGTGNGLQRIIVSESGKSDPLIEFETIFRDTSTATLLAITTIFESKEGDVWIGTSRGLLKLAFRGKDKFLPEGGNIFTREHGLYTDQVLAFQDDPYGNYWVGTYKGICVINGKDNSIVKIPVPDTGPTDGMKEFYDFTFSSDGTLWIAGGQGLFTISADRVRDVFNSAPKPELLRTGNKNEKTGGVMCVREDKISKGIMWVGSHAHGLLKLVSVKNKNFYTNHLDNVLSSAFVFSILKDQEGIYWIGTTEGLIRFDKTKDKYSLYRCCEGKKNELASNYIMHLSLDRNNQLWAGTQRGLYKVNNRNSGTPQFERITVNPDFPDVSVKNISYDKNGDMLIVLPGRLYHFSLKTMKSREIVNAFSEGRRLPFGFNYMCSIIDKDANLWLGSSMGLFMFPNNPADSTYDFSRPLIFRHDPLDTNSLRSHTINDLLEDKKGNIWICTPNGFIRARYKDQKTEFRNFSTRDGLKNNAVYGVLENPYDGTLWMSTNGGLTKFDPENYRFRNFDIHDGLQSNEFNGGAFFRAADNEFLFGGIAGYTSFYPSEIRVDSIVPRVYITSFSRPGEQTNVLSYADKKKIHLKHDQNNFSIRFIALQFTNPVKNKFQYRLEGFDKEWNESSTGNQINYSQLPPGEYIFEVKGSNQDGVFNAQADRLAIIIQPPFWKTVWFYLFLALFIGLVAWLLHAYLLKLRLKQVEEIEAIRKETAADFHDELGHKLTTISWFGEILKKKIGPEQKVLREHLDKIIDTAGSLYHTMRDMVWAMDPGKDSVKDLYRQMKEFGESLFDQTGVSFQAEEPNGEFNGISIPLSQKRHVLLIFKEAMHNSFRHSESDLVKLNLFRENNHITIKLEDNGKGFQADWNKSGNGLNNVKKRSDVIGAKIKLDSGMNGTVLELEIPLKNLT